MATMAESRVGLLGLVLVFCSVGLAAEQVRLGSLDLAKMSAGWGRPQVDRSIRKEPLSIGGQVFEHGVGTHASSIMRIRLDGQVERFTAYVGVDDGARGPGSVCFKVKSATGPLFDSGVMKPGDKAKKIDVPLAGVKYLLLIVTDAGDKISYDHADWAEAAFHVNGAKPEAVFATEEPGFILTPKPGPKPKINGPKVYGARPARPFIYRIPATGQRPMRFVADGLPAGLKCDADTGIITGNVPAKKGEYTVMLKAGNEHGSCERPFKIVVGDTLALTPPMGWNSWYIHYYRVSDEVMRAAADAMIESGMADYGYQYVNIDDCWMVKSDSDDPLINGEPRDSQGAVRPNTKFPDMNAMTDYIHDLGLKAGLYISPGPQTCARYEGSWEHEQIDAEKFAAWGFDFLKYDWCTYGRIAKDKSLEELKKPYKKMGDILKGLDRDVVYNLCQYGMGNVWEWGGDVGGNCWRTTGDLGLSGGNLSEGIFQVGLKNATLYEYAAPGRWNDPDYLLIGYVGDARNQSQGHRTSLTPNEQYAYMSMWCLMASPLIFSGDMELLDEFTLNILCNAEVIEINQDELGKQARIVRKTDDELVLAKPMADGSLAVGLFNLTEFERPVSVSWDELGLKGAQTARDPWHQKDLGRFDSRFDVRIARHGVQLLRLRGVE